MHDNQSIIEIKIDEGKVFYRYVTEFQELTGPIAGPHGLLLAINTDGDDVFYQYEDLPKTDIRLIQS